ALKRSGYLFLLAFAFRLQLWLFGLPAPWQGIFKVDVLNCMGFSIAVFAIMAAFRTVERIRLCAVLGLAIAFLSPIVAKMDWSAVHWAIRAYILPDYNFLASFPGARSWPSESVPAASFAQCTRIPSSARCSGLP